MHNGQAAANGGSEGGGGQVKGHEDRWTGERQMDSQGGEGESWVEEADAPVVHDI